MLTPDQAPGLEAISDRPAILNDIKSVRASLVQSLRVRGFCTSSGFWFPALLRGMPRVKQRQRIVFCDCRDCVDVTQGPIDYSWEAAARQLPPPRSLVLLLEGFNADASTAGTCCRVDELHLPHFDNVARRGVNFCVAVPTDTSLTLLSRVLACNILTSRPAKHSIPDVFKGMQCAVASTSQADTDAALSLQVHDSDILRGGSCELNLAPATTNPNSDAADASAHTAARLCPELGLPDDARAVSHHSPAEGSHPSGGSEDLDHDADTVPEDGACQLPLPPAEKVAARVAELLHVEPDRKAQAPSHPAIGGSGISALDWVAPNLDVLILHVKADDLFSRKNTSAIDADRLRRAGLAWADSLLKTLAATPTLHQSILLHVLVSFAPGTRSLESLQPGHGAEAVAAPPSGSVAEVPGILSRVKRPQQSWQRSGLKGVQVDTARPVLVSAYLKGVTRRDDLDCFCLGDTLLKGGQGCILVDRLMHEIAYKVARALKFGS